MVSALQGAQLCLASTGRFFSIIQAGTVLVDFLTDRLTFNGSLASLTQPDNLELPNLTVASQTPPPIGGRVRDMFLATSYRADDIISNHFSFFSDPWWM